MRFTGETWPWPPGLHAYRITEIPRRDDGWATGSSADAGGGDPGRPQRAAALAAAYHAGLAVGLDGDAESGPIAFGWIRTDPAGPVHVLVAGVQIPGAAGDLNLPGEVTSVLGRLACWQEIAAISDGLLAPGDSGQTARPAPGLEDCLLGNWDGAFGWMIVATPIPATELRTFADDVARRLHLAEASADRFPGRAVEAKRLTERHAEIRRGASTGFWDIRAAVGADDAASAARVAGLFCGAAGLAGLPYTLIPAPDPAPGSADTDPSGTGSGGTDYGAPAAPFRGSTELLAALSRPPEAEIPGFRLALRPEFDVTPETTASPGRPAGAGVPLGDILDRDLRPAGPFTIPLESLNRHVFVCGATGAGKSQTVRTLLEAVTAHGIPWLVVEPAKAEYRLMANRLPGDAEVIRIRPGEADAIAAGLNPLAPAVAGGTTFPLQTHADLVRALFVASFRSDEPFPQVLSAALTRVYEEAGWDLALGEPREGLTDCDYPTLGDLQRAAERVVAEIGYSQRVTDDVLGFIRVRIESLRAGTTGRFTDGGHPIDFGALLRRNVVLEIEDVGDDRDKAFLIGAVLIRLAEHLRLTRDGTAGLRHLTVVEEAHRLLRRAEPGTDTGAGAHAVEMFAGLIAEVRAYGEGLVIAEQIPSKIIPDAVKNSAVKLTHRLPAADDRDTVGATMNVTTAQSRYLVTLPPGQAAAFTDGMDFPVLVRVSDATERESHGVPRTQDCAAVVTPRSQTCGPECGVRPCTLRDMRRAQQVLARYPWVRLWAELTVLGHLTGWPMPMPKPAVLAALRELPDRLTQCAVSHAVDAAVEFRRPALVAAGQSLTGLAPHACAAIRDWVERQAWLCAPPEAQWQVTGAVADSMVFGSVRPSVLEAPPDGLLAEFVDCQWPLRYLRREGVIHVVPSE